MFFDSVDICERSGNPNHYGPILFGMSIDLLKDPTIQSVKITRYNPTKWDQVDAERRYLKSTEYQTDMLYGNFDHMITLQCTDGKLDLSPYLKSVKIDSPNLDVFGDVDIYSYCRGAIRHAIFHSKKFKKTKYIKRMTGPSLVRDYEKLSEVDLKKKYLIPGI